MQDFCSIRFNTSLFNQLIGLTVSHQSVIYNSNLNQQTEKASLDYFKIAQDWINKRKFEQRYNLENSFDFNQFDDNHQPSYDDYNSNEFVGRKLEQLVNKRSSSISSNFDNIYHINKLKLDSDQKVTSTGECQMYQFYSIN